MKSKILISILAIALVSGCVIPGLPDVAPTLGIGNGLEIISFTAEPSPVFGGATVRLIMETENRGGTTVNDSDALVYLTGSNIDSWTGATTYNHFGKTMKAEDVVRGVPADTKRFSWSLTAPALPAGQTRQDTFIGRIYHEYSTSAHGSIWVYSESEAEASRTAGRSMYRSSFTYTKGPVGLQVSASPDPVILYGTERNFTLYIKISNLATGTIYSPNTVNYATGSESITLASAQLNNVTLTTTGTGVSFGSECNGRQELVAGKETTLVCDVRINDISGLTFKSFPVDVTVSYGYYTERTTTITVQGR